MGEQAQFAADIKQSKKELVMKDTCPAIASRYKQILLAKSPEQRLRMGFSMFDAAKKIVESSIINNNPSLSPKEIKREIFLRFYSSDFSEIQRNKIMMFFKR